MQSELKGIKYLLFLIALILLFGAAAVLDAINTIFWIIVILGIIGFIIWIISLSARENEKSKIKQDENNVQEEKDRIYFEQTHHGYTRKKFLGSYIEMNKVDDGPFWRILILLTIGIPLGVFVLAIIIAIITPWIRR